MRESKEKIKSRMIRNAARIWGFHEPQPESSFDPVVSLLLGACALELEKISSEINNTEARIVERLVNILTPQPITGPHPAYAIACAKPAKKGAKVLPENQFYVDVKLSDQNSKASEKQIFFSPTGTFGLKEGRVRYLAANKKVFELMESHYKDIVAEMYKSPLPPGSLFIGLELDENTRELCLFFDVISDHLKQSFIQKMEASVWKTGNKYLRTEKGIDDLGFREHDAFQMIERQLDISSKVSNHVNRIFHKQFINLHLAEGENFVDDEFKVLPDLLARCVDEKERSNFDENVTWIEVQFDAPLPEDLLDNLVCSMNCFPVINRRLNEFTGSTRELINIIPLYTEDVFFDLKKVVNSNGEKYRISHFKGQEEISKGSALLRMDGVGRFDTRSAMEYLGYLLELMKEESAAFNVIGSDMIYSNLRELNQAIARLEKKIEDVQLEKGDTAYLMLKPQEGDRQVFVEFWSTNCTYANNLRSGTMLNVYQADDIDYNASRLITRSTGGKEKPGTEEKINTYRRILLSGDRVVTSEDVKALCFEHFGDSVANVGIQKGVEKGKTAKEGFIRTIDITIELKKGLVINPEEQTAIKHELQVLLEERSSNIFPFRIFIA